MDRKEILVLLLVLVVALIGLILVVRQTTVTGKLISPQFRQKIFQVPNVELPTTPETLEQPFAGRCISDRDLYVAYLVTYKPTTEYAFDGCYTAFDNQQYYYDFYCEGTPRMSQVWVRITPGCKEDLPTYRMYPEARGNYYEPQKLKYQYQQ